MRGHPNFNWVTLLFIPCSVPTISTDRANMSPQFWFPLRISNFLELAPYGNRATIFLQVINNIEDISSCLKKCAIFLYQNIQKCNYILKVAKSTNRYHLLPQIKNVKAFNSTELLTSNESNDYTPKVLMYFERKGSALFVLNIPGDLKTR